MIPSTTTTTPDTSSRVNQVYDPASGSRLVAGCIPIIDKNKIMLISSRSHPSEFILPKGGVEKNESPQQSALRECWEEAGIKGSITRSLGLFNHTKLKKSNQAPESVFEFFEMKVEKMEEVWPEMKFRKRIVVTIDEALRIVKDRPWFKEPLMKCSLYVGSS